VFHSNDISQTNGDGTRAYIQNSNLFWLTGIDQEETTLVLFPENRNHDSRVILFIRQTDAHTRIWEGNKLTKEEATEISGITTIYWSSSFESVFRKLMSEIEVVCLLMERHPGKVHQPFGRNHRFALWCKKEFPLHQYRNADVLLQNLRVVKSTEEIALMRQSCHITHMAFVAACRAVRAGVYEYEIEAECLREIIRHGARGFAYEPIIASGEMSCILHYTSNDRQCQDGEVVLMDIGASYANYASDMTRTVPVNGRFTSRQRAVYDAVLRIMRQATELMRPGISFPEYHAAVDSFADKELVDLGLLSLKDLRSQTPESPARRTYFLHRTAHYLGLDVHDVGDPQGSFIPSMVLTCEPGIYIREESLGVRLENNILITADGNENLLAAVPIEADEIEFLILK